MSVAEKFGEQNLGYKFYRENHNLTIGYDRLDVCIDPTPTGVHFDPEKVVVPIFLPNGAIDSLTVRNPFLSVAGGGEYRIAPGKILISDRIGKKVEVFTFGGSMKIETLGNETISRITSNVPMLEVSALNMIKQRFADEATCMLAERRAALLQSPGTFEKKLFNTNPEKLYCAFLNEFENHLQRIPISGSETFNTIHNYVKKEIERLRKEGIWDDGVCISIKDLI